MTNKHQRQQAAVDTGDPVRLRGKMWSPGRPSTARSEDRVRFWEAIVRGLSSEDAAAEAGVHPRLGPGGPGSWRDAAADVGPDAPKVAKLPTNERLRDYVQDRLAGTIARPEGELVPGPTVRFIGRRHGRRADRRWAKSWSPKQRISNRLPVDFPDDESMRISREAIYQALYVQGRGALKRALVACLRNRPLRRISGLENGPPLVKVGPDPAMLSAILQQGCQKG